jgi:hypothetical protein
MKIFRFEGFIELDEGDKVTISEWRQVKGDLPFEALFVKNETTNKEFRSRTEKIQMLKPIQKKIIKGTVIALREKLNIREKKPIILFELKFD